MEISCVENNIRMSSKLVVCVKYVLASEAVPLWEITVMNSSHKNKRFKKLFAFRLLKEINYENNFTNKYKVLQVLSKPKKKESQHTIHKHTCAQTYRYI